MRLLLWQRNIKPQESIIHIFSLLYGLKCMNEKVMEAQRAFPDFTFDRRWHNLIRASAGLLPPDSRCLRTLNPFLFFLFFSPEKRRVPDRVLDWNPTLRNKTDSVAARRRAFHLLRPCCIFHISRRVSVSHIWSRGIKISQGWICICMYIVFFFLPNLFFLLFLSLFGFGVRHGKVNLACIAHQKQPCLPAAVPKPPLWEPGCCHMLKLFIRILIDRNMII